jgi:holo-[acyl-carrier protein] synthase
MNKVIEQTSPYKNSFVRFDSKSFHLKHKDFLLNSAFCPLPAQAIAQDLQVINIESFSNFADRIGETFEGHYYTNLERKVSDCSARRMQYLAGRFAAKKAIAFVLGKEDNSDNFWLDIEIQRLPTGAPSVKLYGECQEAAKRLGINEWLLSISHTSSYAVANAIALKNRE